MSQSSADKTISIGGACGYWGESAMATPQLLAAAKSENRPLDYLVYDYLAEVSMSIMARARAKDPNAGYAADFVAVVLKKNLRQIAEQKVKVISNAGGVNPEACGVAIRALVADLGLDLKVAVITGDDLINKTDELQRLAPTELYSGIDLPDVSKLASANAYLGAFPIAQALSEGADIVITGRCVDSAVSLGACIHEFGWAADDWDKLSCGTLAGHILECGPQTTGGNFTDWQEVIADGIEGIVDIGYPIADLSPDGSFVVTKPKDTGGLVSVGTVSEQMLYEIGDPQAYIVPDVVCDFSTVEIVQESPDRVRVSGATGYPATDTYKVSVTYADGFRGGILRTLYGIDADKKAQVYVDATLARARNTLRGSNLGDFSETSIEILGAESQYGRHGQGAGSREVVVKLAAKHEDQKAIGILLKEASGIGLATPPSGSGFQGGRSKPSPVIRLFSFLIAKNLLPVTIDVEGREIAHDPTATEIFKDGAINRPGAPATPDLGGETTTVPLVKLAWGRSGDKGDKANIGIIARKPEYLPLIWASLTAEVVADRFAHFTNGKTERFLMPKPNAMNFLLHEALGGGGVASLRNDAQGKGFASLLLDQPIEVPANLAETL
jgi:hypothetical protein